VNRLENRNYKCKLAKAKFVQSQINGKKPGYLTLINGIETYEWELVEEPEEEEEDE
jgi:hypothetical protein